MNNIIKKYWWIGLIALLIINGNIIFSNVSGKIIPSIQPIPQQLCDWRPAPLPPNTSICMMVMGAYFDGMSCKYLSGCGGYAPFKNIEDCRSVCNESIQPLPETTWTSEPTDIICDPTKETPMNGCAEYMCFRGPCPYSTCETDKLSGKSICWIHYPKEQPCVRINCQPLMVIPI